MKRTPHPSVSIKYHIPVAGHPDDEVFEVISNLMNERTGRLYKSLVMEKGIATRALRLREGHGLCRRVFI